MSKIIDFYKNVLNLASMEADDKGYISVVTGDTKTPVTIDGKRLVLPTNDHLRDPKPEEKMMFHPFSENVCRGESEVIEKLRTVLNVRFNYLFSVLTMNLMSVLEDTNNHKLLSVEQQDLLLSLKSIDEKTRLNFVKMVGNALKKNPANAFINMYLNRGGSINDKRYARSCVVTFPFYKEMETNPDNPYGAAIRKKDHQTLVAFMKYIFPNSDIPQYYSRGSDHESLPFFMALMQSSRILTEAFNHVINVFKDKLIDLEEVIIDTSFLDQLDKPSDLIASARRIPPQLGNEGKSKKEETLGNPNGTPKETISTTATIPTPNYNYAPAKPVQQVSQTPVSAQQPVTNQAVTPTNTGKGIEFRSLSAPVMMNQYGQPINPQYAAPVNNNPRWSHPQQPMMNNGMIYGQPVMNQHGQVVNSQPMANNPRWSQPQQVPMHQPMGMMQQPMMQQPMGYAQPMPMGMSPAAGIYQV